MTNVVVNYSPDRAQNVPTHPPPGPHGREAYEKARGHHEKNVGSRVERSLIKGSHFSNSDRMTEITMLTIIQEIL